MTTSERQAAYVWTWLPGTVDPVVGEIANEFAFRG
jgi:hypothetical protein